MRLTLTIIATTLLLITIACSQPEETTTNPPGTTTNPPNTSSLIENWKADGIIGIQEYSNDREYGNYSIYWLNDNQHVYVGIKAKTLGFVAFGIQPGSRMKDADMVLGFIEDGNVSVFDLFSTGDFGPHPEDTQLGGINNILDYGGSEGDDFTIIEFKRELNTGDQFDIPLSKGLNKIIWSFGSNDELEARHTSRGYGEINL
jgi:hypothetical protein